KSEGFDWLTIPFGGARKHHLLLSEKTNTSPLLIPLLFLFFFFVHLNRFGYLGIHYIIIFAQPEIKQPIKFARDDLSHQREVIEHALAHQLTDKAEAAYQRGTLWPKYVELMDD
ncbi:putative integrase (partial), partial [Pectobacterium atrosepticum SCRI1043]